MVKRCFIHKNKKIWEPLILSASQNLVLSMQWPICDVCHLICTPDEASILHTEWSPFLWQLSPNRKSSSYKNTAMRYYTLWHITVYAHTEARLSIFSFLFSDLQTHLAGIVWWQELCGPRFPWTSESQRVSSGEIWEEKMVRSPWSDPSSFCDAV